ncbi:N-acetyl-gamma-glutamyl-phosphate reductase [Mammaliicoccus vitulinus]|uniref:N-acetyl-gamma-glutamyl-phosphate reductase n=1 Tax=Mammaliicoccus vitulinus TaxID=71237 RepID=UPI003BA19294
MLEIGIVGGSGYGAIELMRLLNQHKEVKIKYVFSHSKSGDDIKETYPHLQDNINVPFSSLDVDKVDCDLIFFATPSNVSKHFIPKLIKRGIKVIDLSGDFRLKDPAVYEKYYGEKPAEQSVLDEAEYSLAEWSNINKNSTNIIANPGCFPTAILLSLHPLLENNLINKESIIIDAKTGVSGAGRGLSQNAHFGEANENFSAYKIGTHKHTPEIEQYLSQVSGSDIKVMFTPHLVPMTRGILATIYVDLNEHITGEALYNLYSKIYEEKPFVRIRTLGELPKTKEVLGSNFCDIGIYVDEERNKAVIVAVIDNLVKGASGQAIQNMNILYGFNENEGLNLLPVYP